MNYKQPFISMDDSMEFQSYSPVVMICLKDYERKKVYINRLSILYILFEILNLAEQFYDIHVIYKEKVDTLLVVSLTFSFVLCII